MKLKTRTETVIECQDWDALVRKTYSRPYCFQQQDGCRYRGVFHFTVPDDDDDEGMNDSIPEVVNGNKMGVKFSTWLARDPEQVLSTSAPSMATFDLTLWWQRNFYPDFQTIANDLHKRGLLDAGDYTINIDW